MAGNELTTGTGGLHPGKPVIWPTGKSAQQSTPVSSQSSAETSGGVRTGQPSQAASGAAAAAETAAPAKAAAETTAAPSLPQAAARPEVARQLTTADVRSHLAKMQVPTTEANVRLASLMLRHGVELTSSNFAQIAQMLEGSNQSLPMQEAALALFSKGINSPTALQTLGQQFANNPQLAAQLVAMKDGLANLQTALGMGKGLLNATLVGRLSALMSQFSEFLDSLPKNFRFSGKGNVSREALLSDMRALKSLLQGVQGKQMQTTSAEAQVLASTLASLEQQVSHVAQNLVAQSLISQKSDRSEVNYSYYQVPNSMASPGKTAEIMIRRDGTGPNSKIDPRHTQVIMYVELENLGKIAILVNVDDKKVYCIFNTQNDPAKRAVVRGAEDLKKRMASREYDLQKFQVNVNPAMCAIKPYLLPMVRLEDLMRIDVQV